MKEHFKVKREKDMLTLGLVHPILFFIFADLNLYCSEQNLPLVITRVVGERIPGVSTSDTHKEGRAIDFSVRGWSDQDIEEAKNYIEDKYAMLYGTAPTISDKPKVFVYHFGTMWHVHLQIRRGL